jgi:hypothetical protein
MSRVLSASQRAEAITVIERIDTTCAAMAAGSNGTVDRLQRRGEMALYKPPNLVDGQPGADRRRLPLAACGPVDAVGR